MFLISVGEEPFGPGSAQAGRLCLAGKALILGSRAGDPVVFRKSPPALAPGNWLRPELSQAGLRRAV